jgi:1,4-alpha-glucan branching enzyme
VTPYALEKINTHGVWEIKLPNETFHHGDLYRLSVHWDGGSGNRIPSHARRVVQDDHTKIFNAQVWTPPRRYIWKQPDFIRRTDVPFIYEAHIGMAQEDGKVGTYKEFKEFVLPRIVKAGYNTIQLMAIQEHPYYASFGYQVSSFFAPSSRYGTPEELKELIDAAHNTGLSVIIDLIHSHAVRNEIESLSLFDGTEYQYFHHGGRGYHDAWDSRCFDYGKKEVLHFLLSNCRYWLDEFHLDGFRFDGVTSMLYLHHGLGKAFTSYDNYFDDMVDLGAVNYLTLANILIHRLRPDAITIAEDMSGMPGMALTPDIGGIGFDYRLAMGLPDHWIKLIKHVHDEDWHMGEIWYELNNRRKDEKVIGYAESHDQALVGDQTIIFRLIGKSMYEHMHVNDTNIEVDRGIALHKMIRLITLAVGGDGYLNFMGNEFGHPEWIDFPREGNHWSYHYARRQWHLRDDPELRYRFLADFDEAMIKMAIDHNLLAEPTSILLYNHNDDKVLSFERSDLIFIFNFNQSNSYTDYPITLAEGKYTLILDSDHGDFGGHGRLEPGQNYVTDAIAKDSGVENRITVYIPTRTAIVLARRKPRNL